jgi:hypothetical protein
MLNKKTHTHTHARTHRERERFALGSSLDGPDAPRPYGPLCPIISAKESPVPLPKFQMAPRFKILMSSRSKKGTLIYYAFHSKNPGKRIPSRFPNGTPMDRERAAYRAFLHLS